MKYPLVLGLEVHIELATQSKMFCGCPAHHFNIEPNTHTCPVCLGLPGALPVPNQKAIEWTYMLGKALNCQLHTHSKFDRKHYFYPDLPKGFQLSQYDMPFTSRGWVNLPSGKVNITRAHLEEDTGKLSHTQINGESVSLVDFNRSGVPLVEIVTEPDFLSSDHAVEYGKYIQTLCRYLSISDADMEKGSLRLEANISLKHPLFNKADKPWQNSWPPYKVEVKNLNSFKFMKKAIEYEIERQLALLENGEVPAQETRGWNEARSVTVSQRTKEDSMDYRYFPEPDIPEIEFSQNEIDQIVSQMPMLPQDYADFFHQHQLKPAYVRTLIKSPDLARWSYELVQLALSDKQDIHQLINTVINSSPDLADTPAAYLKAHKRELELASVQLPAAELKALITQALADSPDLVTKYRRGKINVIGALIGQVMRQSQGKADPTLVSQLLKKELDG